ncbi:hypothetical protein EDC01DRAFT_359061 [Geopyxis carbonaria]|nr:hypothetical protein EDC01DRAFT_359061 [Geopyxis carbonaria]
MLISFCGRLTIKPYTGYSSRRLDGPNIDLQTNLWVPGGIYVLYPPIFFSFAKMCCATHAKRGNADFQYKTTQWGISYNSASAYKAREKARERIGSALGYNPDCGCVPKEMHIGRYVSLTVIHKGHAYSCTITSVSVPPAMAGRIRRTQNDLFQHLKPTRKPRSRGAALRKEPRHAHRTHGFLRCFTFFNSCILRMGNRCDSYMRLPKKAGQCFAYIRPFSAYFRLILSQIERNRGRSIN